ncbi:hypothetical protein GGS24DRAFT_461112 [Hypoxylon argillaceum]|nr:hypothetical protein GGS24DRAFT_461112 [Hypoxylon argillaceum]KAI1150341.1 hypothetical protein F4825DRAFT_427163 [Nemania diffusa]
MSDFSTPAQTHDPNSTGLPSRNQVETDVYDLDDPCLIPKLISQGSIAVGPITCHFRALPLNEPGVFFRSLEQYGHVVLESKDQLIMRLPGHNLDLLDCIREAWVSKYMAPFDECRITIDLARQTPEQPTTVIIQRVLPVVNKSRAGSPEREDNCTGASGPSVADHGGMAPLAVSREDEECDQIQRVRSNGVPGTSWDHEY